jgi:hypothetical protein
MTDEPQGVEPLPGHRQGRQRELWAAVKRFLASHPEATQTEAFAHVGEQYGRSASGVGSAFYRIERDEQGLGPYQRRGDRDEGEESETGRTRSARVPSSYRTVLGTIRRQLATVERASQAVGENLDDLERVIADEISANVADRQRLAELETVLSRLTNLLPNPEQ